MAMLALLLSLQAQTSDARARAVEARDRAEVRVGLVEGVRSVGMGGSGGEYRLIIVVESLLAKARVRELLGGDVFEGLRILWTVAGAPAVRVRAPEAPPPPPAQETVPGNFWNARPEDCDILRDHLKLKRVSHEAGNGRYWAPCSVRLRSVLGAGGGHSFTYTKHRPDCPIRLERVGMPAEADRFISWVYHAGYTYPLRAGFTWPYEIRASDSLWWRQAYGDLESRMGYVRSGGTQAPPVPVASGR